MHRMLFCLFNSSLTNIVFGECMFNRINTLSFAFRGCSGLTSIDLTPFAAAPITNINSVFDGCINLSNIVMPWNIAPGTNMWSFGSQETTYTGLNTRSTGKNILYVPSDATGYDSGYWLDPLCNASKCGFTLSKTL